MQKASPMPYRAGGTQVLERAAAWAHGRQNVLLLRGRWQDVLEKEVRAQLGESFAFDGVFFDTYEETVEGLLPLLPRILRPGGPSAHPPVGLGRGSPVSNAQLAALVRRGALLSSHHPPLARSFLLLQRVPAAAPSAQRRVLRLPCHAPGGARVPRGLPPNPVRPPPPPSTPRADAGPGAASVWLS
jgi:hypothetical protein